MKCTKPSSPYILLLTALFVVSWINTPSKQTKSTNRVEQELNATTFQDEEELKQVELISMLNTDQL